MINVWTKELLIKFAIRKAIPGFSRYFGGSFNLCPINEVAEACGIGERNDAYKTLAVFHCGSWFSIPLPIREQIPTLIEAALEGKQ